MSLQDWLNNGWLRKHKTSNQEITNLLEIVKRDIKDAEFRGAYPAMVNVAKSILENERCLEASKNFCMPIKEILTLIPEEY